MGRLIDCHSLARHGDEWLVAYACVPSLAASASLFSVAHAVELYLKAAHVAAFGDMDRAIRYGHRLMPIWSECRRKDPNFMASYEVREEILSIDFLDYSRVEKLNDDDRANFLELSQLYLVFKHLQDLKYFGLPWKTRGSHAKQWALFYPDSFWVNFFRELRAHIGYPGANDCDQLSIIMRFGTVPDSAVNFLSQIVAKSA